MNSTLNKIIIFTAGAAVGSAVTWGILKSKYEQLMEEETKSIKESLSRKYEEDSESKKFEDVGKAISDGIFSGVRNTNPERTAYADIIDDNQYWKGDVVNVDRPYVIRPEEFDELDGYEAISLTYYADGVLADDMDNLVDNIDDIVGDDFADHFGEYEDDSVFIRNDSRKTDYEILRDLRYYSDVAGKDPHLTGNE